jgi:hypothetical protein
MYYTAKREDVSKSDLDEYIYKNNWKIYVKKRLGIPPERSPLKSSETVLNHYNCGFQRQMYYFFPFPAILSEKSYVTR